jgi:hypothetical protein
MASSEAKQSHLITKREDVGYAENELKRLSFSA